MLGFTLASLQKLFLAFAMNSHVICQAEKRAPGFDWTLK